MKYSVTIIYINSLKGAILPDKYFNILDIFCC